MFATGHPFPRGSAVAAALVAALGAALPAFAAAPLPDASASPTLHCRASVGASDVGWTVELDDAIPLATVDREDTPAEYSTGHVRIRLAANGPNLVIGLVSGRLLVTAADGSALGKGRCDTLPLTIKAAPGIPCAAPTNPFHPVPACPAKPSVDV